MKPIQAFAESQLKPDDKVAVEATTNTWPVARLLKPYVAEVVVSNPLRTRAIAEAKVKTDKVDAHTLAQLLRSDYLPAVWQPDPVTERLRNLSHRRAWLVHSRTAVKNHIHSVFHQRLIQPPDSGLFSREGLDWLRTVELDPDGRAAIQSDLRLMEALELEIGEMEQTLIEAAAPDPRLKLLLTLPGVDLVCAEALLAALGDLDRFSDGDHAASYLGLVPSTRQSASHTYHGRITKQGDRHARWVLVQAAQHLSRHPGPLGVFFRRIAHKKNWNVAVVATARKLVVIAFHVLKNNEPYRYAQPMATEQKLRHLRLRAGREERPKGPARGTPRKARFPGSQSRVAKALGQLYEIEGVPPRQPIKSAELRVLEEMGVSEFLAGLEHEKAPTEAAYQDASTGVPVERARCGR